MSISCSYCGGSFFYEGPSGGASQNILCANGDCRHWFNFMGDGALEDLHRVEPSKKEKEEKQKQRAKAAEERPKTCRREGAEACRVGGSLTALFDSRPTWHEVNGADLWRLAGYVEELRAMIIERGGKP